MTSALSQLLLATTSLAALSSAPSVFTVPAAFPTSVFSKYYNSPTATSAQPQPVISDPVRHLTYKLSLTDPDSIPLENTQDPRVLPPPVSPQAIVGRAQSQLASLFASPSFNSSECARCQSALGTLQFAALAAPDRAHTLVTAICNHYSLSPNCTATHGTSSFGPVWVQVIANADVAGYDGQAFCANFMRKCSVPPIAPLNLTSWFTKPKPNPLPPPKKPSGERLKVLHISDFHLDPRYATGSEANCTVASGPCCRKNVFNSNSPNQTLFPAPRFGAFKCDTPLSLGLAALQAIPVLTATEHSGFAWTIYTGDLVSHDLESQLSREYVMYTETVVFDLFKRLLGTGPLFATLGNHDTVQSNNDAPHSLGGALGTQFSWVYNHLASLWGHEHWLPDEAVTSARLHYGGYSVKPRDGLRVISVNGDFWYRANYFNYINMTNPDNSGTLRFLTNELQAAEEAGERAWIIAHVLTGWDGSNALTNPSNLFYQIVDRFSPHVIAGIFFGHTHEDQLSIFYTNNGTTIGAATAQAVAWIGPSLTPITNLNSGFRVYEVDSATYDIMDAHTWKSDVNASAALDQQTEFGPTYEYEYSTRDVYGKTIPNWSRDYPLNATWWHLVTEAMEADATLVETFTVLQGKESVRTKRCTGECVKAKICYIRSGSTSLAVQNCQPGFGSVQS